MSIDNLILWFHIDIVPVYFLRRNHKLIVFNFNSRIFVNSSKYFIPLFNHTLIDISLTLKLLKNITFIVFQILEFLF